MEIVINIPDKDYTPETISVEEMYSIIGAIQQGTVLPKGHGRLIDVSTLKGYTEQLTGLKFVTKENLDKAPTVLEADKGGE